MIVFVGLIAIGVAVRAIHQCPSEPVPTATVPLLPSEPASPIVPARQQPHPVRPPGHLAPPSPPLTPAEPYPIKTVEPSGEPVPQADDPDLDKMIKERDREQRAREPQQTP
jgi:hypothetical protein